MNFTFEEKNNIGIVSIDGNLLGDQDSEKIIRTIATSIENGIKSFIFDAENIKYMNSTGLSILINSMTKARKAEGDVILVNVQYQLRSLLKITKLDSIFRQSDSIENAIINLNIQK